MYCNIKKIKFKSTMILRWKYYYFQKLITKMLLSVFISNNFMMMDFQLKCIFFNYFYKIRYSNNLFLLIFVFKKLKINSTSKITQYSIKFLIIKIIKIFFY